MTVSRDFFRTKAHRTGGYILRICAARPLSGRRARNREAQMKRMLVVVPLTALTLSACSDRPRMWRESEIQAIAEDFADAAATDGATMVEGDLSTRIDELQRRVDDLERENRAQDEMIEALRRHQGQVADYLSATR